MAFDKVVDSTQLNGEMTATANAIRAKTGGTDPLVWKSEKGFAEDIAAIEAGIDTSDATASEKHILSPYTAYVKGEKIRGRMNSVSKAPITINVDTYLGKVIATATQLEGFVTGGIVTKEYQLPTYSGHTYTPGINQIIVSPGRFLTGMLTIEGDGNLVPENIAEGVSIFGVEGTAKSVGITDVRIEEVI